MGHCCLVNRCSTCLWPVVLLKYIFTAISASFRRTLVWNAFKINPFKCSINIKNENISLELAHRGSKVWVWEKIKLNDWHRLGPSCSSGLRNDLFFFFCYMLHNPTVLIFFLQWVKIACRLLVCLNNTTIFLHGIFSLPKFLLQENKTAKGCYWWVPNHAFLVIPLRSLNNDVLCSH